MQRPLSSALPGQFIFFMHVLYFSHSVLSSTNQCLKWLVLVSVCRNQWCLRTISVCCKQAHLDMTLYPPELESLVMHPSRR